MIILDDTDILEVESSVATDMRFYASWIDNNAGAITPGRSRNLAASTTAQTIVDSPAAGVFRNVKEIYIYVEEATTVDVRHVGVNNAILVSASLDINTILHYSDGVWSLWDSLANNTVLLPSPAGNIGKYLTTTDGTTYSWGAVDTGPGEFMTSLSATPGLTFGGDSYRNIVTDSAGSIYGTAYNDGHVVVFKVTGRGDLSWAYRLENLDPGEIPSLAGGDQAISVAFTRTSTPRATEVVSLDARDGSSLSDTVFSNTLDSVNPTGYPAIASSKSGGLIAATMSDDNAAEYIVSLRQPSGQSIATLTPTSTAYTIDYINTRFDGDICYVAVRVSDITNPYTSINVFDPVDGMTEIESYAGLLDFYVSNGYGYLVDGTASVYQISLTDGAVLRSRTLPYAWDYITPGAQGGLEFHYQNANTLYIHQMTEDCSFGLQFALLNSTATAGGGTVHDLFGGMFYDPTRTHAQMLLYGDSGLKVGRVRLPFNFGNPECTTGATSFYSLSATNLTVTSATPVATRASDLTWGAPTELVVGAGDIATENFAGSMTATKTNWTNWY